MITFENMATAFLPTVFVPIVGLFLPFFAAILLFFYIDTEGENDS